MIKNIIIPTSGPILPLLGGVHGPILHPFPIDVKDIPPIIVQNHKVHEYLRNGSYVALNLSNYNKPLDASGPVIKSIGENDKRDYTVSYNGTFEIPVPVVLKNHEGEVKTTTVITHRGQVVESINAQTPGLYTVTYRAMDSIGAVSEPVSIKVVVLSEEDVQNPIIKYSGPTLFYAVYGSEFVLPVVKAVNSKDEDIVVKRTIKYKDSPVDNIDTKKPGQYDVEYTASDAGSRAAAPLKFTVHVAEEPDTTAPVINYSGPTRVNLLKGEEYNYPVLTATDNKDVGEIPTTLSIVLNGNTSVTNIDTKSPGVYTLTYMAKDSSNNYAVPVVITVTVLPYEVDEIPPVLNYSGDTTFTIEYGGKFVEPVVTATDNKDIDVTVNKVIKRDGSVVQNVDTKTLGVYKLTYTASDKAGNDAAPLVITVVVVDTKPPVFNYSDETTINVEYGSEYTLPTITATDSRDGSVDVTRVIKLSTVVKPSIDTRVSGTYYVIHTASDKAGNEASPLVLTVNIVDTTPPVIKYTEATEVTLEFGASYTLPTATATDNKDSVVTVTRTVLFEDKPVETVDTRVPGIYEIKFTARDAAGNQAKPVTIRVTVKEEVQLPSKL